MTGKPNAMGVALIHGSVSLQAFPTGLCNPGRFGSSWTLYPDRTMM